jgi:hypothetical protein
VQPVTYRGVVRGQTIVLKDCPTPLADGVEVLVMPVKPEPGTGKEERVESPTPAASTSERRPIRQRICDLPLPPEVASAAKQYCKRLGLWGAKSRRQTEEEMKLQHYYGGKWIAYLRTNDGPVVVAAADSLSDPVFDQQLCFLTEQEQRHRIIECPVRLFDDESQILNISSHES